MLSIDECVALAQQRRERDIAQQVTDLGETERRALARELVPAARRLSRGDWDSWSAAHSLWPALLACCTMAELRKLGSLAAPRLGDDDIVFDLLTDRRPGWLAELAEWMLEQSPQYFCLVRRLVRAGLIPRPDSEAYILGMVALLDRRRLFRDERPLRAYFDQDPDLLEHEVWRLFEVEGGGETSLASLDKYSGRGGGGWAETLKGLSDDGSLPRARLLDASLEALGRDFSSFRAGWYSRFHEAMEPTIDERAARQDAYFALLTSRIANTVSFAMRALTTVDRAGRLEHSPATVERLSPAVRSERAGTAKAGLRMLERAMKGDASLVESVALVACGALGHADAAVQSRALDVVELAPTTPVRGRLLEVVDVVAPTLRERHAALVGLTLDEARADEGPELAALEAEAEAVEPHFRALAGVDEALRTAHAGAVPPALTFRIADIPVIAALDPIEPIRDLDDLVDCVSRMLDTAEDDAAEFERGLHGLSRLSDQRPADFERRTSALRARAAKAEHGPVVELVYAWIDQRPPRRDGYGGINEARVLELAQRVACGSAGPLLSAPTHAGGWIDPRVFVARLQCSREVARHDLIAALCRLAPDHRGEALAEAASLDLPQADLVRFALGGPRASSRDLALSVAVELARTLDVTGPSFAWALARRYYQYPAVAVRTDDRRSGHDDVPALRIGIRPLVAFFREPGWWWTPPRIDGQGDLDADLDRERVERKRTDSLVLTAREVDALPLARPAGHQALWAQAVLDIEANLRSGEVGFPEAYAALLGCVLDSDRPLGEMGAVAIILALAHGNALVRAAGIDAAIVAIGDGRLDMGLLGSPAQRLVGAGVVLPGRLGAALRTVAADSALHAEVVRLALERIVALDPAPRNVHALLEPLNELAADAGAGLTIDPTREALGQITGKGKAARLAAMLLERQGTSRLGEAAAAIAVEARIERARRWSAP